MFNKSSIIALIAAVAAIVLSGPAGYLVADPSASTLAPASAPASRPASAPAGNVRVTPLFELQHPVVDTRGENPGGFFISPGGKHIAYVVQKKDAMAVVLDGAPGKDCDEVLRVVYSPDGEHLAAIIHRDEKQVVVLDGKEGPAYDAIDDGIDAMFFSPDSKRLAYIAHKGEQKVVVLDGRESKQYDDIFPPVKDEYLLQFSPDSKHLIFLAERGEKRYVVTDLAEADDDGRQHTVFSPDGKREAHVVIKDKVSCIMLDGVLGPEFDEISDAFNWGGSLTFSADGKHFAYAAGKWDAAGKAETWRVVLDGKEGKEGKPYDFVADLRLGPDGRLGYIARDNKKKIAFAVIDGKEGPACDQAEYLWFGPDGKRYVYIAWHGDKQAVVIDGVEGKQYLSVDWMMLDFSPGGKHIMYTARSAADKEVLVLDGKEGRPCDKVFAPKFSGDGEHVLYVAGNGGKYADEDIYNGGTRTVMLDGNEQVEFASLPEYGLVLSHDGKHWACWGHDGKKDNIILDGDTVRSYDDVIRPLAFIRLENADVLRAIVRDGKQVSKLEIKAK